VAFFVLPFTSSSPPDSTLLLCPHWWYTPQPYTVTTVQTYSSVTCSSPDVAVCSFAVNFRLVLQTSQPVHKARPTPYHCCSYWIATDTDLLLPSHIYIIFPLFLSSLLLLFDHEKAQWSLDASGTIYSLAHCNIREDQSSATLLCVPCISNYK
jgi:hypothetical protein